MGNLVVDTTKLNESGTNIQELAKELNEEFNALFSRISNMNTKTMEWIGPSSQNYIQRTNLEKIQYINLVKTINNYGKLLISAANAYEKAAKK